ncbi:TrlF family AAA-like ATPase [Microbispora hainanensis]|uniref:AAA family ATPase n=1 Tax=Microbispora hainanensis TaxID=568844 RepID=A0A544YQ46_9ACTN|nr:hypothetical protein [Microbispora hainanensis]TQS18891.1 hypothetical protein FLX08_22245 [Microbispora hainanensis]
MSRWFKCDLQVATPGWKFKLPASWKGDLKHPDPVKRAEYRQSFADMYMATLRKRGVDVIALADHHTAEWLEEMKAAGGRAGITVFPGVEVVTTNGSDGVHLLLIGGLDKTERDIDILLAKVCGFDDDHPRYVPGTRRPPIPAPAPRSIQDILRDLPPGWIAIGPHALGDNGIASGKTIMGTARWQVLHDDKLAAIDVGSPADPVDHGKSEEIRSWNQKFRARKLDNFPCLERLAFVSTSDAYSLETLGGRFTWIRMAEPTLEGLRQAFLDFDARIICDWDQRLTKYPGRDPNQVTHAWVENVTLDGKLGNSATSLKVEFAPGLNVIIGGRGSGKSTVVSGLRRVYGSTEGLPEKIKVDLEDFYERVFAQATLSATHHLPISGETQVAVWTTADGSHTDRGAGAIRTNFPLRVFSQKELYERIAPDSDDPNSASRHLLTLIDEALDAADEVQQGDFSTERSKIENVCHNLVARRLLIQAELEQRADLQAREAELGRQVAHLDNPATRERRERNEAILREHQRLESSASQISQSIIELRHGAERLLPDTEVQSAGPEPHHQTLRNIKTILRQKIFSALSDAEAELRAAEAARRTGEWAEQVQGAREDDEAYQAELVSLGVDQEQYLSLREELALTRKRLNDLAVRAGELAELERSEREAWLDLMLIHTRRGQRRRHLVEDIKNRSQTLRFVVRPYSDWTEWARTLRRILNLRSDGYSEEVRSLARWLWNGPTETLEDRLRCWRSALITNSYSQLSGQISSSGEDRGRPAWWRKLAGTDQTVRIRLATLVANDTVSMLFLKSGGRPERDEDWQDVVHGSPGQRSAAMLSFVLHQGTEPLVLDQPEDDLDTTLISELIVNELRKSRWKRQLIVVTHNANIPVLGDADRVIVLENVGNTIRIKTSGRAHVGPIDVPEVRTDIQNVMEGGVKAFIKRGMKYDNEVSSYRRDVARLTHNSDG